MRIKIELTSGYDVIYDDFFSLDKFYCYGNAREYVQITFAGGSPVEYRVEDVEQVILSPTTAPSSPSEPLGRASQAFPTRP